jgi:Methylamine utilisation protein MauE
VPTDALISAPLIVAAVFVASAVGKLAEPRRAAMAFDTLKVPRPLAQPWMRTAHPWAELLIALCLIVTWGVPAVVTAIMTTALACFYVFLIVQALRRPEPTDCACFGLHGSEQVTGWTVIRNIWLLGLSVVCVWAAMDGRSPLQRAVELGSDVWWLAAMVAAATMTALIVYPSAARPAAEAEGLVGDLDLEDYVRTEIPHVPVTTADGSVVSLRELAGSRPKLILAVSGTCSSCARTIDAAPQWRERLPEVDIHLLYASDPHASDGDPVTSSPSQPPNLYDPKRYAYEALRLRGTPSAVLLGADGMLAGGPVAGHEVISTFVADVEAELSPLCLVPK